MAIGKNKKHKTVKNALAVPQTGRKSHPFNLLGSYTPMHNADMSLYKALREAIPVIDAAILKIVRLMGGFEAVCESKEATQALSAFLRNVNVGGTQQGIDSFMSVFIEQLLTYGTAVGEIVTDGKIITHLFNSDLRAVALTEGKNPLDVTVSADNGSGELLPVKYPELVLLSVLNPEPGKLYGTSILKGLPFVSNILLKIYNTVGINWERVGNVRFAVTYKPQNDTLDMAYAQERATLVADEWSKTIDSNGSVKDFIAIGDVSIKAIGSDIQIIDSEVPVRQMLEQIIAKLGIPPFILGLNWSTTERMSAQQADILTSEIEFYRRAVEPVIRKICSLWLRMNGFADDFAIEWESITLQDITELARSRYYIAQAEKLETERAGEANE